MTCRTMTSQAMRPEDRRATWDHLPRGSRNEGARPRLACERGLVIGKLAVRPTADAIASADQCLLDVFGGTAAQARPSDYDDPVHAVPNVWTAPDRRSHFFSLGARGDDTTILRRCRGPPAPGGGPTSIVHQEERPGQRFPAGPGPKEPTMCNVALKLAEAHPIAKDGSAENRARYRAQADANAAAFEAEFATAGVSRRALLAVYCLHRDRRLVEAVLALAWHGRLS